MITSNLLYIFIAGVCVFLLGINVAFVIELRRKLAGWFSLKLLGVSGLLAYTMLSVLVGNPSLWRACIAFGAVLVDLVAFVWMYSNVQALHRAGTVGLIPLARFDSDHGGFALQEHDPADN